MKQLGELVATDRYRLDAGLGDRPAGVGGVGQKGELTDELSRTELYLPGGEIDDDLALLDHEQPRARHTSVDEHVSLLDLTLIHRVGEARQGLFGKVREKRDPP
jgi:hypothetical protein